MAARPALRLQPEESAPDSWKRFFVVLTGKTNGAHESVVKHFKSLSQTEVKSPGDADYCLVFCPVVSIVGTDVSDAMDYLLPGKEAVLVVMHQTFNPEQVIPPSSRVVEDQRVRLTLDCLFYQGTLLKCELNKNMKSNVKKFFKESKSKGSKIRQQADSSDQILKAFNDLKEETRTMKQQQMVLVQKIETLQVQNDEKDKKIQESRNERKESQNYMSEPKQNVPSLVKYGPKGVAGPVVSGGEPGSMEDQGAASFLYEDITKYFKSKEESNRRQQTDSSDHVLKALNTLKNKNKTMTQQQTVLVQKIKPFQVENYEKDKKIQELQNELKQKITSPVKYESRSGVPVPAESEEPGSMEDQGATSFLYEDLTKYFRSKE